MARIIHAFTVLKQCRFNLSFELTKLTPYKALFKLLACFIPLCQLSLLCMLNKILECPNNDLCQIK